MVVHEMGSLQETGRRCPACAFMGVVLDEVANMTSRVHVNPPFCIALCYVVGKWL